MDAPSPHTPSRAQLATPPGARSASLHRWPDAREGFESLRADFARANPGYALEFLSACTLVREAGETRALFVHGGEATAEVRSGGREPSRSPLGIGDVVLLRAGERLALENPLELLSITLPGPFPAELPTYLRPDWDPRLTDTPGGCAEDSGAYRRILLTWLATNGPYVHHALNAHRVRMTDSLSHYHPRDGGFDELYLVQGLSPGARLYTSTRVDRLRAPDRLAREELVDLVVEHPLAVGDLIWFPRETMHRAIGGVLAQVITVPGFRPGAELGLDHHLRAINERFGLRGESALPYREASSHGPVKK
jgi:hypothetical protein